MALCLVIVAVIFFVIYVSTEVEHVVLEIISFVCCAIAVVLLLIANRLPRNISVSTTNIPINNADSFCVTSDITNGYVYFADGYDNHYVIPKEKAIIETFSDNESNAISVELVTVTNTISSQRDLLSDLGAFDFSTNRYSEYYYFFIPESAKKLQEETQSEE